MLLTLAQEIENMDHGKAITTKTPWGTPVKVAKEVLEEGTKITVETIRKDDYRKVEFVNVEAADIATMLKYFN